VEEIAGADIRRTFADQVADKSNGQSFSIQATVQKALGPITYRLVPVDTRPSGLTFSSASMMTSRPPPSSALKPATATTARQASQTSSALRRFRRTYRCRASPISTATSANPITGSSLPRRSLRPPNGRSSRASCLRV
jgi:hypothetical protein